MYEIVIGRFSEDKHLGLKGTIFLGKQYVRMGQTVSLANNVFLDIARSHVVYICGKRGSGKSYTMGVIAEGLASTDLEVAKHLSVVILDTMGIYWTMKYPNKQDKELLKQWGLEPKGFISNVKIFVPEGFFNTYKEQGMPVDEKFAINPKDLDAQDWLELFGIDQDSSLGVLITSVITSLKQSGQSFNVQDVIKKISLTKDFASEVKKAAIARFKATLSWGLFNSKAPTIEHLVKPGVITVIDVSCYSFMPNSWTLKSLVVGLFAKNLFKQRMLARRFEEINEIEHELHSYTVDLKVREKPLVWLFIDEAHEFLPAKGKTLATDALITILREGRQPGISLVLATQQPGKIHGDVVTQSDIVISHRVTARVDVKALEALTQSYMVESLVDSMDRLPRVKGSAVVFDDTNERLYAIQIRPRVTWHGGSSPKAVREDVF